MSATLKVILITFGLAGILLMVGLLLRSKIKVLQKLFLPASVIGGFLGLLIIVLLKLIPSLTESVSTYTTVMDALPGILVVPILAASPLGNFKKKSASVGPKTRKGPGIAMGVFFVMCGMMAVQMVIGLAVQVIMKAMGSPIDFYKVWGFELACGFVGGHGTAASVGAIYSGIASIADYASAGKDVATTFATFGLVGGMLLGIVFINIAARKGKTAVMKEPTKLEGTQVTGLVKNIAEQESLGRETTKNFTIETITVHLSIITGVIAISYGLLALVKKIPVVGSLLGSLPVWSFAMLIMMGVNKLLEVFHLEWLVDKKVSLKIAGFLTDFAVVCAIASMNLSTIATYMLPIIICSVLGFVVTFFYIFGFSKHITKGEQDFEHGIIAWGTSTGVLMTGLVLLKVCDPNYETKALSNFSAGFAVMSVFQTLILGVIMPVVIAKGTNVVILGVCAILAVVFTAGALIVGFMRKPAENAR